MCYLLYLEKNIDSYAKILFPQKYHYEYPRFYPREFHIYPQETVSHRDANSARQRACIDSCTGRPHRYLTPPRIMDDTR